MQQATNIQNKAVQVAPSMKGVSALIFDGNDVIVISEQVIKEQTTDDGTRPYQADGQAYIRHPDRPELQKNLSRDQRRALARRGITYQGAK